MPFKLGPWELAAILIVVMMVFGAGKLPEVFRKIGGGLRQLKKGLNSDDNPDEPK